MVSCKWFRPSPGCAGFLRDAHGASTAYKEAPRPSSLGSDFLHSKNPKYFPFSSFPLFSSSAGKSFRRAEQWSSLEQQEAERCQVRAESSELGFDATESRTELDRVGPS